MRTLIFFSCALIYSYTTMHSATMHSATKHVAQPASHTIKPIQMCVYMFYLVRFPDISTRNYILRMCLHKIVYKLWHHSHFVVSLSKFRMSLDELAKTYKLHAGTDHIDLQKQARLERLCGRTGCHLSCCFTCPNTEKYVTTEGIPARE